MASILAIALCTGAAPARSALVAAAPSGPPRITGTPHLTSRDASERIVPGPRGECGDEQITQSNNPNAVGPSSAWCGTQQFNFETSLARGFTAPFTFDLRCVTFGITSNTGGEWPTHVRILLGGINQPYDQMVLVAEQTVAIPAGTTQELFTVQTPGVTIPAGTDFVVELNTPSRAASDGGDGALLSLGCNIQGQAAATYVRGPACQLPDFVTLESQGFGNRCLVMTLGVQSAIGNVCCYFDEQSGQIVCDESLTAIQCAALNAGTWVTTVACSQQPCASQIGACCFVDASCNLAGCVITSAARCASEYPNSTFHPGVVDCGSLGVTCATNPPFATGTCVPSQTGLRHFWPFDETAGTMANDLAGFNNGSHAGAVLPVPAAGAVSGALSFDGTSAVTAGPLDASFMSSAATHGMSAEAWIYPAETSSGFSGVILSNEPILATRGGFEFGLDCGSLYFSLVDSAGNACIRWSNCVVPPRVWTHVGVWSRPSSANPAVPEIALFINGVNVPTSGSCSASFSGFLSGNGPLSIGATPAVTGFCPLLGFVGSIDNVALHDRAVQWWAFSTIFGAGAAGYCLENCHSTWETACYQGATATPTCPIDPTQSHTRADFQVCNFTTSAFVYNATISPVGVASAPCSPPPSGFTPLFLPSSFPGITLPAGSCTTNSFCVLCPAPVPSGHYGCWDVAVTNTATQRVIRCGGSSIAQGAVLYKRGSIEPFLEAHAGSATSIAFDVTNVADISGLVHFRVIAMASDMPASEFAPDSPFSLDGLPPGEPVIGELVVPMGETATLSVDVGVVAHNPFRWFDIIVEADVNDDGALEPVAATALRILPGSPPVPCLADFNLDGTANSQDYFDFLVSFFNNDADFNADGITNSQDFFDFLVAFFNGC